MKKVIFAIQVFALIISLPTYVLLELNRETSPVPKQIMLKKADEMAVPKKPAVNVLCSHWPAAYDKSLT